MKVGKDPLLDLVTALMAPEAQVPQQVFREGIAALRGYLRRRYSPPLTAADVDEVAGDAISRLYEASERRYVSELGNPTGYLIAIANRMALAAIKASHRTVPVDSSLPGSLTMTDEAAAARLDRLANVSIVRQAMADARRDKDATAVRLAAYLLDEIQCTGDVPSSRTAARALGISHVGVAKALRRLRAYLVEADRE
ncbi:hypothetical protein [Actinoplanes sp. NPDC049681]|uniref:hypothetical protein n=1 Tax=Actinoplanes sp. NPDC049681 TaxID=3363905 RepID=UPI00379FD28A